MNKVQEELFLNQDLAYKSFQEKLIPNINKDSIIGVRTPKLKMIARKLNNDAFKDEFLNTLPHQYFEENLVHSFLIALEKNYDRCINLINEFLPQIDNWAVCDQARPNILAKDSETTYLHIKEWISKGLPYYYRYAIKQLMSFYLDDKFEVKYLDDVANISSDEYYVKMMQGWFFATALAKQYKDTIIYIEESRLNKDVNNITIKKAIESYRISEEQKEHLRRFRIK